MPSPCLHVMKLSRTQAYSVVTRAKFKLRPGTLGAQFASHPIATRAGRAGAMRGARCAYSTHQTLQRRRSHTLGQRHGGPGTPSAGLVSEATDDGSNRAALSLPWSLRARLAI